MKEYACPVTGLGMSEEDVKIKHRADVYYFNVDIKFIIKARMHLLREKFEEHVRGNKQKGSKWMCKGCEFGKEK